MTAEANPPPVSHSRVIDTEGPPYAGVVDLLEVHAHEPGDLVLDIGGGLCGIAEAVRGLGLVYVGLKLDVSGPEGHGDQDATRAQLDLRDDQALRAHLGRLVAGRPLALITAGDVMRQLISGPHGRAALTTLSQFALSNGRPPLVVCVEKIAPLDLVVELMLGICDISPAGMSYETRAATCSPERLARALAGTGWSPISVAEVAPDDDQELLTDPAKLIRSLLRKLAARVQGLPVRATPVSQLIRAYVPVAPASSAANEQPGVELDDGPAPLLSVLLIPGEASEAELIDVLIALDAQSVTDFELIVVAPESSEDSPTRFEELLAPFSSGLSARSRVVPGPSLAPLSGYRTDAIRAGSAVSRGRYITVLDGRSVVFGHFVEVFARLATEHPAAVLRARAIAQPMRQLAWPGGRTGFEPTAGAMPASTAHFSLLEHLVSPGSPPGSYALERSYVDGFESGCEEDEMLAEAAMLGGVHETPGEVTLLLRRFGEETPIFTAGVDSADQHLRANRIDVASMALRSCSPNRPGPPDPSIALLLKDVQVELADVRAQLAGALGELAAVRDSTSWHLTAALRWLSGVLHRAGWQRSD
ncbi:MAG TPA: glycosyltransferase family A protein [Acidimicrobiales bacterium]|nr:glycosyltransferase family A protein [Acidimicrobiales bacterium]